MNETTSTFLRGESSRYHRDAQHFMEQAFLALQSEILVQVERAITDTIQSQQRDDGRLWMYGNELRKRIIDTIGKTPVVGNK